MARPDEESAISLFSFQDIITSITGIMFLVVLLLLLIAVTSRPATPKPAADPADELKKHLTELRRQLADVMSEERDLGGKLAELRKLSPEAAAARLAELRRQLRETRHTSEQAAAAATRLEQQLAELTRQKDALERRQKENQRTLAEAQRQLNDRTRELDAARKKAARNAKVIDYAVDRSTMHNPVLAELGADGVRLLVFGENRRLDFRKAGQPAAGIADFLHWAGQRTGRHEYYSLLVKPGGFEYAMELSEKLRELGLERGMEILPDDQATIFAEDQP